MGRQPIFPSRACSDTALNLVKLQPLAKCGDNAVSKTGLVDLPLKTDFAREYALFACTFPFCIQVAFLEFFFERDVRFFGTAIKILILLN